MRLTSALAVLAIATSLYGGDAPQQPTRPTFINAKVSSKRICLNEAVRVEFTTMPRDVENIDIAAAVANAVRLGGAETWRLVGKPTISEQLGSVSGSAAGSPADPAKPVKERPKPITVVFSLLPRKAGDLLLPDVPVTWIQGSTVARFDTVVVSPQVMVGGTAKELPKEVYGVAGYTWKTTLESLKDKFTPDQVTTAKGSTMVKAQKNLSLIFSNGSLSEAKLFAPGLGLDQARASFLERWGVPQEESANELAWVLGWTRIAVNPFTGADGAAGIQISLTREDILADQAKTQVKTDVFGVLEGPKETPEEAEKRKAKEIQAELNRPEVPAK